MRESPEEENEYHLPEDSSDEGEYHEPDDEAEYSYPDVVVGEPMIPDITRMPPNFRRNQSSSSDHDGDQISQDNTTKEDWYASCDVTTPANGKYFVLFGQLAVS